MHMRLICSSILCLPTFAMAADMATVKVEGKAAPIVFAGEEIRAALKVAGWTVSDKAGTPGLNIVLAKPDGKGEAEAFAVTVKPTHSGRTLDVRVRGKDVRGIMYGGLDVAEQIALSQGKVQIVARAGKPFLAVRGLKFNLPLAGNAYLSEEDQAHGQWFWDLEYWRAFMRFLAYHRYNLLSFWNSHPYDQMVRIEKYPEANGLPKEKLDANIAFFHKLFGMAREYGLDTSVVTWNIHTSAAFKKAHNVKDGQDSPLIRDYQRECVKALLKEYPELTGMGTCPGEAMGGTADWREEWIRDTYFPGISAAGREKLPFILRYWGGTPPATAAMLAKAKYPGPVYLDIKFNGEHMYSSVKPHLQDQGWLNEKPMPYKLLWHLRNDCIYQFRWCDPDFAAGVVKNIGGPDSAGFVMGSEIEVPGTDRVHTPQTAAHKTWKYEFEKNWTRFGLWGRAGYNPDEPHEYWIANFSKRFGPQAGPAAYEALVAASKIIPLTTSFHWNYMNGDWYPEGNVGVWNTSAEMSIENYRDNKLWHNILEWTFNNVIDDSLQSIPDYVADQLGGARITEIRVTPLRYADQLEAAALTCAKAREQAAARIIASGKGEWECTERDLKSLEFLGRYYASKARAATDVMFFLATGEEPYRARAAEELIKALDLWKKLSAVADNHYAAHEIWLYGKQFDWKRYIPDAEHDIQMVRELVPWTRSEQKWSIGDGAPSITSVAWSLPPHSPAGLQEWLDAFSNRVYGKLEGALPWGEMPKTASTDMTFSEPGTALITLRSGSIVSARISGEKARIAGGQPEQFLIGAVRSGANHVELTFKDEATAPPVVGKTIVAPDAIFLEAESGEVTPPMAIKDMAGASSGKVVWAPTGKGRGDGPGGKAIDNGWVTYKLEIPKDGDYLVHTCVWWNDTAANTFFYAWDKAAPKVLGNDDVYKKWHWLKTEPAHLAAGAHTLTIRTREEGAVLDCLLLAREESVTPDPAKTAAMLDHYYERLAAPHHLKPTTLDEWKARRPELRKLVLRDIGLNPMPEKLPLNVTYGGQLDRGDYIVKRTYWQTWPGVYASGYLYLPKTPGKHPAMLSPHGHLSLGTRDPAEQTRSIVLAKKGYVSLAVDSVHLPAECFLIGATSIGVMTYNGIRGVDLLESLPEVDATHIGCCGMSGGGQQTVYMMTADDRIAAAVPVVFASYFRRIMNPAGFPHCICNVVPGMVRDVDVPEMIATFAPKPAFYESVTGDWEADFPKQEFPELQAMYALYDAKPAVTVQQWDWGHDYNKPMREPTYAFLNHHFKNVDDAAQATEPDVKNESLETLATLDKPPADAKPLQAIIDWYKAQYAFKSPEPTDAAGWQQLQQDFRKNLSGVLGDVLVHGKLAKPAEAVELLGTKSSKLLVQTEADIQIPVVLMVPAESQRAPAVILIHDKGIPAIMSEYQPLLEMLLAGKAAVAIAEVRLTGGLARNWPMDCILFGRPEAGMAATDLRAIVDVLTDQPGIDAKRIALIALGDTGVSAVCSAAMDERLTAVAVPALGATYAEGRKAPLIANVLRAGDLPQVAATIAPRALLLGQANPTAWAFSTQAFRAANVEAELQIKAAPASPGEAAAFVLGQVKE